MKLFSRWRPGATLSTIVAILVFEVVPPVNVTQAQERFVVAI